MRCVLNQLGSPFGLSIQLVGPLPSSHSCKEYNSGMKGKNILNLEQQQEHLELLRARIYAAKTAYLNRAPFEDKEQLSYDDLRRFAQEFINASYHYQKSKYGSIKVPSSVPKLLRR